MTTAEFKTLMERLASAWGTQNTEQGLSCFTHDAIYIEPPDVQYYRGHEQLRPYFAALKPGTFLRFHHLWFDEDTQTGAGEFSFGELSDARVDHGIVVAEISDGRIAFWREYLRKGPAEFEHFISIDGKAWQWHIGNYP